jgi:hypothetical protein
MFSRSSSERRCRRSSAPITGIPGGNGEVYGISDPLHVAILHFILIEHDCNEIKNVLQRHGIPNDLPEFDNMPHDPISGEALVFSGLNAKPLDLDGKDTTQRYLFWGSKGANVPGVD